MTISSTTNRATFTGNGVTRTFAFSFPLLAKADLKVYVAGVLKTLGDYVINDTPIAGPFPSGVTVTFPLPGDPPASGASVILLRDPEITQATDLVENDPLSVESGIERPLDRLTMIAQRLDERIGRAFALADTDISGASTVIPTPQASKLIGWNSDGDELQNYSAGELSAEIAVSSFMETVLDDASDADARATLGASAVGDAVFTAANEAAARTTLEVYSAAEVDALLADALAALLPAGSMVDFGGGTVPDGYLGCDGSNILRATYPALFTAIGETWGAGDGSTTFALPDSRRRVAVGSGGTGTAMLGNAVGDTGGEEDHTSTEDEMPAHVHAAASGQFQITTAGANYGSGSSGASSATNTASKGGGDPHNNMQPGYVVTRIIKT